jgi:hypothetical protein
MELINLIEDAYRSGGIDFTQNQKIVLLSEYPKFKTPPEELQEELYNFVLSTVDIVMRFFWKKVSRGETFAPVYIIKERLGKSVEDNFVMNAGPFINLANAYWTFKIVLDEFGIKNMEECGMIYFQVLRQVENMISGTFFPAQNEPKTMSVTQRMMRQEKILQEYAPNIDAKSFLSNNPILKSEQNKGGCLGTLLL